MSNSINTSSENIAYTYLNNFSQWGSLYIGSAATINQSPYAGIFEIKLNKLFNKKIAKITQINLCFTMRNSDSGYNGCIAKISYIGKNLGTNQFGNAAIWRVGSENDTVTLIEPSSNSNLVPSNFSTSDLTTCKEIKKLILESKTDDVYYFKIEKVADIDDRKTGATSSTNVKIEIIYEESNIRYYYNGSWKQCIPYYYTNGQWKQCIAYYYKDSEWKQT